MSNMVCIIQARFGSTRLPGKTLYDLGGMSMLERVVYRVYGASEFFDRLIVATGDTPENDVIEDICDYNGWQCFRGNEGDVLNRFRDAAHTLAATDIIRICADDPFIDPDVIAKTVLAYHKRGVEYAATETLVQTYPIGMAVEVFPFRLLEEAWLNTHEMYREHVTPYLWKNKDKFNAVAVTNDVDKSHIRLTVDTLDDYRRARKLYDKFGSHFDWEDVVRHIERRPDDYTYDAR